MRTALMEVWTAEDTTAPGEFYYRCEAINRGEGGTFQVELYYQPYHVLRRTEKGVWIRVDWDRDRFILDGSGKRFAYPTKEAAKEGLLRRKLRQIGIVAYQHDLAQEVVALIRDRELPSVAAARDRRKQFWINWAAYLRGSGDGI